MRMQRLAISWLLIFAVLLVACGSQAPGDPSGLPGTGLETPGGTIPPDTTIVDTAGLTEALRATGASVEMAGTIEQPFFAVSGQILRVNDTDVQVFEFPDEAVRQQASDQIAPDGSTIGSTIPNWVDQPNFWAQGRMIVLYVGQDANLINLLTNTLGEPITLQQAPNGANIPPEAALEAQRRLSQELGVAVEQIQIVSVQQTEWSDACLGLGAADEVCAQVLTPGWQVILAANGQQYEARTNEFGTEVRIQPAG
jgi:hypothetical protein